MFHKSKTNIWRPLAALGLCLLCVGPLAAQSTDSDEEALRRMTESVLSGLGVKSTAPAPEATASDGEEGSEMRGMTDSVLAGLNGTAGVKQEPQGPAGLSTLISRAINEGQSDDYLKALLNEAVSSGEVSVSSDLKTTDNGLDTDALIYALRSEAAQSDSGRNTDVVMRTGVEASRFPFVPMGLSKSGSKHYYRIKPNDSLTGIALRAYGDAALYTRVFEANNDRLESPHQISVGQRLHIPDIR